MSEQDSPEQELQAAPASIDRIGPTLVAARESLGLGAEDVANRLRLSLRQVQALENDDFAALPEAVITRGFIRNYARLVNIDAAPLLRVYSQYVPVQDSQAISIPSANIVISGEAGAPWRPYMWFGILLVVLMAGWVLYVDFYQAHDPDTGLSEAIVAPISDKDELISGKPEAEALASPDPMPPAPTDEPAAVEQPAAVPATPSAVEITPPIAQPALALPAAEDARIKFTVTEATWVSVSDANGKQIMSKTLEPNSEEVVTGKPPFRIVVGNIHGTKLEYNNNPVDLAPYAKVNVARLTLE
ncbi:helix-turn-helix domain-containing protein [Methylobacillus flagellatus]|uniref:Cytoskeleton protein RodZ-like C-terminal domain-containing protein n=1 Tax=Methylobacillus flagellatus (strain ATCC 51484 / DSM 6875 / VKM B-1610 / KT) TaxID=265072 RepID=Q1H0U8_METFK|nr:helix-turn-helix domain-containing protein [Methylobacillus flagellatus]ABE49889.1 conserved hypothetical protein [Methylobacillus flagellatus KT]